MVNEEELRAIAAGEIVPPESGFFSDRHGSRWNVMVELAQLMAQQLKVVSKEKDIRDANWGLNKCGRLREGGQNSFLRLNVPFPISDKAQRGTKLARSKDDLSRSKTLNPDMTNKN